MHPGFAAFWAGLRLTSNKYHVIRRGERGFSAAMDAAGLRVAGNYDGAAQAGQIAKQDDAFLHLTLKYVAYIDASLVVERNRLLECGGHDWCSKALTHIGRVLDNRLGYSSFPNAMARLTGYPLLEKSFELISRSWRLAHLAAVEAGDLPAPPAATLAEIRARDARPCLWGSAAIFRSA